MARSLRQYVTVLLFLVPAIAGVARAQPTVTPNVVFGMHGGLALLMDVMVPDVSNGRAIVYVQGGGWLVAPSPDARQLKERGSNREFYVKALAAAGYTVFVINHRAGPIFPFPAALEDIQRAVRFIRHHAADYRIEPESIGLLGTSSGGQLSGLAAVVDSTPRDEADLSAIEREDPRVQAVVLFSAPTDLTICVDDSTEVCMYFGRFLGERANAVGFAEASPITHVSSDDPPTLLVHGDADDTVPFEQSPKMKQAFDAAGGTAEFISVQGGDHGLRVSPDASSPPDIVMTSALEWFGRYLTVAR